LTFTGKNSYYLVMEKLTYQDFDSLLKAISDYFGGKPNLARALNRTRHAIYQWKRIPEGSAYHIEKLSDGYFKAEEIKTYRKHTTPTLTKS